MLFLRKLLYPARHALTVRQLLFAAPLFAPLEIFLTHEHGVSQRGSRETSGYACIVEPLADSWGREIKSLRVSVTDKCNFRCRYCMPAEGLEWLGRDEILSFEKLTRVVPVLAGVGGEGGRLPAGG